jgi:hypothetical protein
MIEEKEYFSGKVKTLSSEIKGQRFTVGIMEPGDFTFGTSSMQVIEVIFGEMEVGLPDGSIKTYGRGETFTVESEKDYNMTVEGEPAAYLCLYK